MFSYIETSPILLAFFAGMLVGTKESIHCQVSHLIQNHINGKFVTLQIWSYSLSYQM